LLSFLKNRDFFQNISIYDQKLIVIFYIFPVKIYLSLLLTTTKQEYSCLEEVYVYNYQLEDFDEFYNIKVLIGVF
jgi:hypothetical protein